MLLNAEKYSLVKIGCIVVAVYILELLEDENADKDDGEGERSGPSEPSQIAVADEAPQSLIGLLMASQCESEVVTEPDAHTRARKEGLCDLVIKLYI